MKQLIVLLAITILGLGIGGIVLGMEDQVGGITTSTTNNVKSVIENWNK